MRPMRSATLSPHLVERHVPQAGRRDQGFLEEEPPAHQGEGGRGDHPRRETGLDAAGGDGALEQGDVPLHAGIALAVAGTDRSVEQGTGRGGGDGVAGGREGETGPEGVGRIGQLVNVLRVVAAAHLHDGAQQVVLGPVVAVDQRMVHPGPGGHVPDGHPAGRSLGEELGRGAQDGVLGRGTPWRRLPAGRRLRVLGRGGRSAFNHGRGDVISRVTEWLRGHPAPSERLGVNRQRGSPPWHGLWPACERR